MSGNNYHALECVRRSLYFVPDPYKDVPLNNLANILYKWGRVDDAVLVMRDAIATNALEVITFKNFTILAIIVYLSSLCMVFVVVLILAREPVFLGKSFVS